MRTFIIPEITKVNEGHPECHHLIDCLKFSIRPIVTMCLFSVFFPEL